MNERQFRDEYRARQLRVEAPEDLKARTRALIELEAASAGRRSARPAPGPGRRRGRRVLALAAAACLAAAALALPPLLRGGEEPLFTATAYAVNEGSELPRDGDGRMVFEPMSDSPQAGAVGFERESPLSQVAGTYTGCVLRIEAEGASSVQAYVDGGEFYSCETETVTEAEDPGKWAEAISWKPARIGMGDYYSGYDAVIPCGARDDGRIEVRLFKRLGQTVDLEVGDDGTVDLGLWSDENEPDDAMRDFEGSELVLTVAFEDGRSQTQVFSLSTCPIDGESEQLCTLTLCAELESTSASGFPRPLDDANPYEDSVASWRPLDEVLGTREATEPLDGVLDHEDIADASETLSLKARGEDGDARPFEASVEMSGATAAVTKTLPEDVPLLDNTWVAGMGGDLEYASACSDAVFGYSVDEGGGIRGDWSFVVVDATLTNPSDRDLLFYVEGIFGTVGAVDPDSGAVEVTSVSLWGGSGWDEAAAEPNGWLYMGIGAGESLDVRLVYVVPDALIDSGELAFVSYEAVDGGTPRAVRAIAL